MDKVLESYKGYLETVVFQEKSISNLAECINKNGATMSEWRDKRETVFAIVKYSHIILQKKGGLIQSVCFETKDSAIEMMSIPCFEKNF